VEMNNQPGQTRFPGSGETISGNRPTITSGRGTGASQRPGRLQLMVNFAVSCAFWVLVFNMMSLLRSSGGGNIAATPGASGGTTSTALAVMTAPIGSLGPKGSSRQHYRYYDSVFYSAVQFGSKAQSAIEVGCAGDPFLRHLSWIGDRTCVAPYFEAYDGQADKDSKDVKHVVADFMEYKPKKTFDLLLCNQVIEHVQDPAAFMKKLIESATISIISAPYNWPSCGKNCGHVTDNITPSMFAEWSSPYKPVISEVIMEGKGAVYEKRFLWVFDRTNDISRR